MIDFTTKTILDIGDRCFTMKDILYHKNLVCTTVEYDDDIGEIVSEEVEMNPSGFFKKLSEEFEKIGK